MDDINEILNIVDVYNDYKPYSASSDIFLFLFYIYSPN